MGAAEVFGEQSRWATYVAEVQVSTLVGGIPKDPDTIRKWLKARLELDDVEVLALTNEALADMAWAQAEGGGVLSPHDMTSEQLDQVVDSVLAKEVKGNSFKAVDGQLQWEGRCAKAAYKEAANALYPGVAKWPGAPAGTRKGLASYLTERVEVVENYIPLGRTAPDVANENRIKHVTIPGQGKRSTINVVDLVTDVKLTWHTKVLDDCISRQLWSEIWEYLEVGGLGADRARGDGRCELLSWRKVEAEAAPRRRKG